MSAQASGQASGTFKRALGLHFCDAGDELFLTMEDRDVVACINRAAFSILENLDGFSGEGALAEAMAKTRGLDAQEMRDAVTALCQQLLELGILERVPKGRGTRKRFVFEEVPGPVDLPKVLNSWQGEALRGGLFVACDDDDIHVIVPNVTDGPITTCPPQTCTCSSGVFTPDLIIRTFDDRRLGYKDFGMRSRVYRSRR